MILKKIMRTLIIIIKKGYWKKKYDEAQILANSIWKNKIKKNTQANLSEHVKYANYVMRSG
jgi:hypothetical protein